MLQCPQHAQRNKLGEWVNTEDQIWRELVESLAKIAVANYVGELFSETTSNWEPPIIPSGAPEGWVFG